VAVIAGKGRLGTTPIGADPIIYIEIAREKDSLAC
jgi:hypothetical protein